MEKWETLNTEKVADFKIFQAYQVERRSPDGEKRSKFVTLDSPNWVNIIPITKGKKVVLIEQYRHGSDEVTLEVPGGLVESGEESRIAAERECMEETGFGSDAGAELLGINRPNPAFMTNVCGSYVWFDCEKKSAQKLDGNEQIDVVEYPLEKIKNLIAEGKITHSLVLTAFFFYSLKYGL